MLSKLYTIVYGSICLFIFALSAGCGDSHPPTYPVTGTVRFSDGKPLTDGSIEFELIDRDNPITATGEIDPAGNFSLGMFDLSDGTVAGKYRVAVFSDLVIGSEQERPGSVKRLTVDKKFRNFGLSGLQYTVEPSPNHFEVVVEYADEKKE